MWPEYQSIWRRIVDFLSSAYFWVRVKFFVTVSNCFATRGFKLFKIFIDLSGALHFVKEVAKNSYVSRAQSDQQRLCKPCISAPPSKIFGIATKMLHLVRTQCTVVIFGQFCPTFTTLIAT